MRAYHYDLNNALFRTIFYPFASMTIWAPDFTEESFSKVKHGTSEEQVLTYIGEPLYKFCNETSGMEKACDWIYTRQGARLDAYDRRAISFDEQGRVDVIWHGFDLN